MQMEPDRWQRAQALFHAAVARPEAERRALLETECGGDEALVNEVLALLRVDAEGDSLLERGVSYWAHEVFDAPPAEFRTLGPYRIVRVLGRGGMGIVYLGERLDRRVAIKVLRDASLSPARRERFEREQKTLARLTHPSIARLYDADVLGDGTPYFVMEYVEGVPLTEHCEARGLAVADRLKLFREVCDAVHYAHRHAIVHRDLKPSNVLVTADGSVRLLDFGIAKQLDGLDTSAPQTQTGLRLMTPAFAAPEQLRGEPVGVHTDIYALGAMLYQLLTGTPPFNVAELSPGQAEGLILLQEPEKPSMRARRVAAAAAAAASSTAANAASSGAAAAASSAAAAASSAAAAASSAAAAASSAAAPASSVSRAAVASGGARLGKRAWADLDVVCLKAMHKDPQRRYATVESLLRDLDHYLRSEPLEARPDETGYRVGKFVRRNRRAVTGVAIALAAIVAVAGFYTSRLAAERSFARGEAAKAKAVAEYLIGLFEAGDPFARGAEPVDIEALLERGVERAESLTSQPAVRAQMFDVLGRVYMMQSEYERAEALLAQALELRRALPETSLDEAETLDNLAQLRRQTSEYERAEALAREALAIRERHLPAAHADLAATLDNLGVILSNRGRHEEAEAMLRRALEMRRAIFGDSHELLDHTLNNLAVNQFDQGNYDAAEQYYREALAVARAAYGPEHPYTAVDLANLGVLLETRGDYEAADGMLSEALRITRLRLGEDHYETAFRATQLGGMLRRKGDYDAAEMHLRNALEIESRVLEPNHRNTAVTLNHLGLTMQAKGDYAAAEPFLRRAVEVFEASLGARHPFAAIARCNLAYLLHLAGRNAEAEPHFRAGLAVLAETLPEDHDMVALAEGKYGALLTAEGRFTEAEPLIVHSHEVLAATFGPQHADTSEAAGRLATLYQTWGRPADAERYLSAPAASANR